MLTFISVTFIEGGLFYKIRSFSFWTSHQLIRLFTNARLHRDNNQIAYIYDFVVYSYRNYDFFNFFYLVVTNIQNSVNCW